MGHGIFTLNTLRALDEAAPVLIGIPPAGTQTIMRTDMHKVICERPRLGSCGPWKRSGPKNVPLDALPRYQSMRGAHTDRKQFGENLAPLRRWLLAQVGRPWDEVYSEACKVIKPDSVVRNHIKFHLLQMVERHTFLKNGEVWIFGDSGDVEVPITSVWGWGNWVFYVCPKSGRLFRKPAGPRSRHGAREQLGRETWWRWVTKTKAFWKCEGCWFECEMRPITQENELQEFDFMLRRPVSRMDAEQIDGKPVFCAAKRQLSSKELRKHGLTNEAFTTRGDQSLAA